jgi:hypothetical protein
VLAFLREPVSISVEYIRPGGKGHYAGVEALATPATTFAFTSVVGAWDIHEERREYEPSLLQGLLLELVASDQVNLLGLHVSVTAVKTDEVLSSAMAFFNVGRLLAIRILATETRSGELNFGDRP